MKHCVTVAFSSFMSCAGFCVATSIYSIIGFRMKVFLLLFSFGVPSILVGAASDREFDSYDRELQSFDYDFEVNTVAPVYLDVKTTSGSLVHGEIFQIAAKADHREFNQFIMPENPISEEARLKYQIEKYTMACLKHRHREVQYAEPKEVFQHFVEFLEEAAQGAGMEKVALIAHNAHKFEFPIILREMKRYKLLPRFVNIVAGFVDTHKVLKEKLPDKESHTLEATAEHYGVYKRDLHDALGEVRILEEIVRKAGLDSKVIEYSISIPKLALGERSGGREKTGLCKLSPEVPVSVIRNLAKKCITLEMIQRASLEGDNQLAKLLKSVPSENMGSLNQAVNALAEPCIPLD